jgi:hypothetical protein
VGHLILLEHPLDGSRGVVVVEGGILEGVAEGVHARTAKLFNNRNALLYLWEFVLASGAAKKEQEFGHILGFEGEKKVQI